jgi:hypothetical protein
MLALIVGLAIMLIGGCVSALRMASRLPLNSRELAVLSEAGMAISLIGLYFLLLDLRAVAQAAAHYGLRGGR